MGQPGLALDVLYTSWSMNIFAAEPGTGQACAVTRVMLHVTGDPGSTDAGTSVPRRIVGRIKHSFTRDYISTRAERLRVYAERLHREAVLMDLNPTIRDLLNEYVPTNHTQ